jgi:hypothetical protein
MLDLFEGLGCNLPADAGVLSNEVIERLSRR